MPVISDRWEKLTDEDWRHFVEQYLLEINESSADEIDDENDEENDDENNEENNEWGLLATEFQFTSPPDLQWKFILLAVSLAENDEQLADIAAGGIEHLLGWHGEKYIETIEREVKVNPKLARAMTGVWKYMMSDEVWERVLKLQALTEDKLA